MRRAVVVAADMSAPMEASYNPMVVEAKWAEWWEANKLFQPDDAKAETAKPENKFVMVIPPPNVTGNLHIGHTLTSAIEDSLTRWHRMKGDVTLWVPGCDHAGIATQTVVEKQLAKQEGKTRHDFTREAFVDKIWEWKEAKGNHICYQLRRIGSSVDWSREAFTMNPMLSKAVVEAFVRLYDSGKIYRGTRLVSWCPHLRTALSDIEVDSLEVTGSTMVTIPGYDRKVEVGVLVHFCYKLQDSEDMIEVATTRIETMLGDTAVAVHPEDERYKRFLGKRVVHPFIQDRVVVVVGDAELVDPEFGTGAVKITPAHDHNDYACGVRHKLPSINILTTDGKINENGGMFQGMHRYLCRFKIQEELGKLGLLREKKNNEMRIGICSRSGDIIEPMLVPQWWMNCESMAQRACEAVRSGDLKIVPDMHSTTWFHWLENIKPWCISRQLWWGHRILAYRVTNPPQSEEVWVVGRNREEAVENAKKQTGASEVQIEQDEDVLDTWFSSGLFPFSVFGWPDDSLDLKRYFPTTLLETGHDILFFWVARMVMMSLELLDVLPFSTVYLHAMVRDAHGRKMAKSLGNVIDPLEVIEGITLEKLIEKLQAGNLDAKEIKRATETQKKDFPKGIPQCGADALRFGLLAYTKQGRSVNLDINRVVGYRNFCNKLWNATKFALLNFPEGFKPEGLDPSHVTLTWADRWMLHRASVTAKKVNEAFHTFNFADAVQEAYEFWWYQLCDIYLELLKPRLAVKATPDNVKEQTGGREVLFACLDRGLRILHPLLPFVTEELYHRIPQAAWMACSISVAEYPEAIPDWICPTLDEEMKLLEGVAKQLRSLGAMLGYPPKLRPVAFVRHSEEVKLEFLKQHSNEIKTLAKVGDVRVIHSEVTPPVDECARDEFDAKCDVFMDLSGMENITSMLEKLELKKQDRKKKAEAAAAAKLKEKEQKEKESQAE